MSRSNETDCGYRARRRTGILLHRSIPPQALMPMPEPRMIRKYANRRLYDTEASSHINLDDVRELIAAGTDVRIIDDASGDDITRNVLLQLVAEQELGGRPVLSDQLLTQIIRFYDHPLQGMLGAYLQQSFEAFLQQQKSLQAHMKDMLNNGPFAVLQGMAKHNIEAWQAMQKAFVDKQSKNDDD